MKQALISPDDAVFYVSGWTADKPPQPICTAIPDAARVAEVSEQPFEVAPPLFWTICPDDCQPDVWYYNLNTQQFALVPPPAPMPQPVVDGAQPL